MPAYFIAQIDVHDPEEYQHYLAGFFPIFERYGGELLVASSKEIEVIEGAWALGRAVVLKFPSIETARAWKDDPDYRRLAAHRWRAAKTNMVLVAGAG